MSRLQPNNALQLAVGRVTYEVMEVAGRGAATWFAHPDELATPGTPPFPMIVGHPLVPILDAAAFTVGGARPAPTLIP